MYLVWRPRIAGESLVLKILNFCHSTSDAIYCRPKQFNNFSGQGPGIEFKVRRIRTTPTHLSVDQGKFLFKKVKLNYHLYSCLTGWHRYKRK
jgi:hypothetical protein